MEGLSCEDIKIFLGLKIKANMQQLYKMHIELNDEITRRELDRKNM